MAAEQVVASWLAAAKEGNTQKLRQLLKVHPGLLHSRGEGTPDAVIGNTAAHWAAAKGHQPALCFLLEQGTPVHTRNNGDSTALHCAVLNKHAECIRELVAAGADPLITDEFGDSPRSLAEV
eukprot:1497779-Pleurochrysis_carterae.AAC.3